jgi:hypothetical protein
MAGGYGQRIGILLFVSNVNYQILQWKESVITTYPSSSGAREPISVAVSFNLLRKRRVRMEDVKVSKVREVDRILKRRLTFAVIVKGRHA